MTETAGFHPAVWRVILAILSFCTGAGIILWGVVRGMERVERVNSRLPVAEQFGAFFWGPEKGQRFRRTYKLLFPGDNGPLKDIALMFAGVLLEGIGVFLFFP